MMRDLVPEEKAPRAATLLRYKTFVTRHVNGIPVEGHRAVISYATDGSFYRANLLWPPIASKGHQLSTTLGTAQIAQRTQAALSREGEASGQAILRWKYLPVKTTTGEVTLRLVVAARITPKYPEYGAERREINVEVR
jgi:hypothetical protein